MKFQGCIFRIRSAPLIISALAICGCNVIGPQSISGGRGVYAEVINRTADEEILNVIVRMRYEETFGMMSVASITANLRFSTQVGTNIGVGSSDNYAGNLVPISAGVAYEENPTISYIPLSGEDFMRRMLSPVPLNEWLLVSSSTTHPGDMFDLAVRSINGLRNSLLGHERRSPEFARLIELYDQLRKAGVMDIVHRPETEIDKGYFWTIHDYEDAYGESVREFLDLLDIKVKSDGSTINLPYQIGYGSPVDAIQVELRSIYDVLRVFGAGIDIPSSHLESGIVEPINWLAPEEKRFITIRSSEKQWWDSRPNDASIAIHYQDRWFYIDATDIRSKRAFKWLQTFSVYVLQTRQRLSERQ
ncbi:MAG: hypothetical protein ABFS45_20160 [Pseudomonadota bacterium]